MNLSKRTSRSLWCNLYGSGQLQYRGNKYDVFLRRR